MQIQDFLTSYQAKSNEELLQLAAAPHELTSEARFALESELSRRQLRFAADSSANPIGASQHAARQTGSNESAQEVSKQGIGDFISEVLRTYHSHFWLFFKITAPCVAISTSAFIAGRDEAREIARHIPRGAGALAYRNEILEIGLLNLSSFVVSWMAFAFAFAAICIAVEENAAGFKPSAWHSLRNVRERFSPFVRLSLLLFALVGAAEVASMALATAGSLALGKWHVHLSRPLLTVLLYGVPALVLLLLSRLALSLPALVLDDWAVWQSLFRSVEFTRGKWPTLAALLAKSLIGGYVAAMCPFWLASFFLARTPLPSWFSWVLTAASVIGVSAVEPTMFVGFALLYLKMTNLNVAPSEVPASQLA